MKINKYLLLIVFLGFFVKSDLPTNCTKSQIQGKWVIERTVPTNTIKEPLITMKCGHYLPSHQDSSYKATDLKLLLTRKKLRLRKEAPLPRGTQVNTPDHTNTLKLSNEKIQVELTSDANGDYANFKNKYNNLKASWTMVYNEGFDIVANRGKKDEVSYFAFLKYDKKKGNDIQWDSYCYRTLIGWYKEGDKWGCFIAHRTDVKDYNAVTSHEVGEQRSVVQPDHIKSGNSSFMEKETSLSFVKEEKKTKMLNHKLNIGMLIEDESTESDFTDENKINENEMRFSQSLFDDTLYLHSGFKDHDQLVERLNSESSTWKAEAYNEFKNLSLRDLRKFRKSSLNLDLSNYSGEAKSQGNCGSCYIISTVKMLESRIKFLSKNQNKDIKISEQYILECSIYNQGCDGGYSYPVLKFASQNRLLTEKCYKKGNNCQSTCDDSVKDKYVYVHDYYYVGGSYGRCSEKLMEEELKNGPIAVGFNPPDDFNYYKSGIFISKVANNKVYSVKNEFYKVDHSVLIVGFGIENGQKYWKLQNSWGPTWGESGYFKLPKGINYMGIESIAEGGRVSMNAKDVEETKIIKKKPIIPKVVKLTKPKKASSKHGKSDISIHNK